MKLTFLVERINAEPLKAALLWAQAQSIWTLRVLFYFAFCRRTDDRTTLAGLPEMYSDGTMVEWRFIPVLYTITIYSGVHQKLCCAERCETVLTCT